MTISKFDQILMQYPKWKNLPEPALTYILSNVPPTYSTEQVIRKGFSVRITANKRGARIVFKLIGENPSIIGAFPSMSVETALGINAEHARRKDREFAHLTARGEAEARKAKQRSEAAERREKQKRRLKALEESKAAKELYDLELDRPIHPKRVKIIKRPRDKASSSLSYVYASFPFIDGRHRMDSTIISMLPEGIHTLAITSGLKLRIRGGKDRARKATYMFSLPSMVQKFLHERHKMPLQPPRLVYPTCGIEEAVDAYNRWLFEITGSHDFYYPQCERPDLDKVWGALYELGELRPKRIEHLAYNTREAWIPRVVVRANQQFLAAPHE